MARTSSITHRRVDIPAALLQAPTRPNYFPGRLLSADDFRLEQEYLNRMRHLQNLATLGVGVVTGLAVSEEPGGTGVRVSAGYAIDAVGREIIVPADVCMTWPTADQRPPRRWGVVLEYAEHDTDPVSTTGGTMANTVSEGYAIAVITERPGLDDVRVVLRPYGETTTGRTRSG